MSWHPEDYLRFEEERTRPCRDLANRINIHPRSVIDLGCGPGNSTVVLSERWPQAQITGLDSSESMLRRASSERPNTHWVQQDIAEWAAEAQPRFDLVFSNAALQWVDEHRTLFPLLMRRVAQGGALAVQMPADVNAPAHRIMRERFPRGPVREWFVHGAEFYYDILSASARSIDLWTTDYIHVLPSVRAIADWYRSTGLRPFLECLDSDDERQQFLGEYIHSLGEEFQPRSDGRVLFPFRRLFLIAHA